MVVWLNHWFDSAYYFIDSLKNVGYHVIASNKRKRCIYSVNADEFYVEPRCEGEEYLAYCLDFCKTHNVEVFIPKRGIKDIICNLGAFREIGVKVLCEDNVGVYNLLNNKMKTASYFALLKFVSVPEHMCIKTYDEFCSAYEYMQGKYDFGVGLKYNSNEGEGGFKRIVKRSCSVQCAMRDDCMSDVDYNYLCSCLKVVNEFKPMILTPYLLGTEVNVDCLGVGDKFFAVPRFKFLDGVTRIEQDARLYAICREIWRSTGLKTPFSVKFIYAEELDNEPCLLGVNIGLSDEVWKDTYVGFDFVKLGVDTLLDNPIERVSSHFTPVSLSNFDSVQVLPEEVLK